MTAGTAGAAADAATTGAAEAAAARSGAEKRHIDDVTPGQSLKTRARAREWTEGDDQDDSEMSVEEEEEDSAEEDSEVEQTAGDTRANWVKDDVALLRDADLTGLKKHTAAWYNNVFRHTAQPGGSSCMSMFLQEQTTAGSSASRTGGCCGRFCVACRMRKRNTSSQRLSPVKPCTPCRCVVHPRVRPRQLAIASWKNTEAAPGPPFW